MQKPVHLDLEEGEDDVDVEQGADMPENEEQPLPVQQDTNGKKEKRDDLVFLRVRTHKHEIMIAPGNQAFFSCFLFLDRVLEKMYTLVVIQNPAAASDMHPMLHA